MVSACAAGLQSAESKPLRQDGWAAKQRLGRSVRSANAIRRFAGGETVPENLQMLCADCNARKSDKF
ncbi:MAG: HNH endonuclease [Kiritimatiellae bacterium]|nr:HNH endonuclease [Kiritimatiellia bacterium]